MKFAGRFHCGTAFDGSKGWSQLPTNRSMLRTAAF